MPYPASSILILGVTSLLNSLSNYHKLEPSNNINNNIASPYSSSFNTYNNQVTNNPNCDCGEANIVGRIFSGTRVPPHKYPWMVNLRIVHRMTVAQCGGTLIDNRHVLTAAHCVFSKSRGKVAAESIIAFIGADSLDDLSSKVVRGESVFTLPGYSLGQALNLDLAIVRLKSTIDFNYKRRPICLPASDDEPYSAGKLTVAGWGVLDSREKKTTRLNEVKVDHIPRDECSAKRNEYLINRSVPPGLVAYVGNNLAPLPNGDMCALNLATGGDACGGDSGGPLMYNDPTNNRWYQVGIVSGAWDSCGVSKDIPGLYTQVKTYRYFIRQYTNACFKSY